MKPGSVVSVGSMRAFYTDGNEGPMYTFADGSRAREDVTPADPARTLVVIDPEDREQAERLAELIENCGDENHCAQYPCGSLSCWTGRIAAALREFANPIPPQCTAALIVKGQHFYCDTAAGHDLPHGNSAAEAIWGVTS